jgi:NADH-quinone oxidoreductase subunit J
MTPIQFIFILTAAATLSSAIMVVTTRNLIHAALWLIVSLFGVAVFFVLLNAGFLAMAQVVIYIGAIAILMIFAIMLTRRIAQDVGSQVNRNWPWALLIVAVLFVSLTWLLGSWAGFTSSAPPMSASVDPITQLGRSLVDPNAYLIPFEVASVLLLAAMVGAIMIAWNRGEGKEA